MVGVAKKEVGRDDLEYKKKNNVGVLVSSVRGKVMLTTRIPLLHVSPTWKGSRLKNSCLFCWAPALSGQVRKLVLAVSESELQ